MFKLIRFKSEIECRSLVSAVDKCFFVTHTEDCENGIGIINYLSFLYCNKDPFFFGGIFILAVLLLFLFVGLASATNNFFCPALQVMAKKMKMSDNVAGVTLLALGNGAPDIFSSLAGVQQNRAELVFGELFGAGIFVTTVVAGTICIITPFHVMERPFLRDCVFYLSAVFFVFCVFYQQYISVGHAVGFITLYIVYVIVVIVARIINSRWNGSRQRNPVVDVEYDPLQVEREPADQPTDEPQEPGTEEPAAAPENVPEIIPEVTPVRPSLCQNAKSEADDLMVALKPFSLDQWNQMTWYGKVARILEVPFNLVLKLTIPLVDGDAPRQGWCRLLNCIQLALTPSFLVWALGYGHVLIGKILPVPLVAFICGLAVAMLMALFTQRKQEPRWHWLFAFITFAVSIIWINLIIGEILAVLFTYGVVFQLSDAILGLTILAWGNSVGDFVADISMARQNAPRMGFSACYGAPLLNTLLGLGISFVVVCTQLGQNIALTYRHISQTMTIFLVISLVSVFVYLPLCRFQADRRLGILLFVVYAIFLVLASLEEAGILWPDVVAQ